MTGLIIIITLFTRAVSPAAVDIWCDTHLAEVTPYLFGSGDEMDEDFVPLAGLTPLVGETGVTMLRMGGIANEYYDWEGNDYNGVRYIDLLDTLIVPQNVQTSMDDLLQMCEANGIEPILSVNFQINDPGKAERLVEYCNGDQTTPMGQVRAARGHPEPYDVVYWQIGNEPDISGLQIPIGEYTWTMYRHFGLPFGEWSGTDSVFATPEQFAQLADTYADAMRSASPIPVEIATMSLAGDLLWLKETVETCGDNTDWVDLHYYPSGTWETAPPDTSDYIEWLMSIDSGPMAFDQWYQSMVDSLDSFSGGADIDACVMEYNAIVVNPDLTWWNYIDGLFVADCLGHLAEQGCPMAGCYSIFEGSETDPSTMFGMIRGDTLSMRATAWVMKLFSQQLSGTMVLSESDASGSGYGLDVHAALRDDGKLCIMAVNKHLTEDFQTGIQLHGYTSSGYAELRDITNNAPMAAPSNGTTGIVYRGGLWGTAGGFSYTFPAASVTCLLVHPEGSGTSQSTTILDVADVHPVPASVNLTVTLVLEEPSPVELALFDASGRAALILSAGVLEAGSHTLRLDTGGLPSGSYVLHASAAGGTSTRKLVVL